MTTTPLTQAALALAPRAVQTAFTLMLAAAIFLLAPLGRAASPEPNPPPVEPAAQGSEFFQLQPQEDGGSVLTPVSPDGTTSQVFWLDDSGNTVFAWNARPIRSPGLWWRCWPRV